MVAASFAFYCEVTSKKAKIQRTARPEGARHENDNATIKYKKNSSNQLETAVLSIIK
jgi:hypothetical protein